MNHTGLGQKQGLLTDNLGQYRIDDIHKRISLRHRNERQVQFIRQLQGRSRNRSNIAVFFDSYPRCLFFMKNLQKIQKILFFMEHIGRRNDKFTAVQPVGSIRGIDNGHVCQLPVKSLFTGQQVQV